MWVDTEAEEAAEHDTSIFPRSRIVEVSRYGSAGPRPEGMAMTVRLELDAQTFVALNGGPEHRPSEAVSFHVDCADQAEVDRCWSALAEGGEEGRCGWLKDRYGLSWQIVPRRLVELLRDPARSGRGGCWRRC